MYAVDTHEPIITRDDFELANNLLLKDLRIAPINFFGLVLTEANEKYIGTVIMQKTFVENHLTKDKRINNGELPRFIIENAHESIVSRGIFDKVQARLKISAYLKKHGEVKP